MYKQWDQWDSNETQWEIHESDLRSVANKLNIKNSIEQKQCLAMRINKSRTLMDINDFQSVPQNINEQSMKKQC